MKIIDEDGLVSLIKAARAPNAPQEELPAARPAFHAQPPQSAAPNASPTQGRRRIPASLTGQAPRPSAPATAAAAAAPRPSTSSAGERSIHHFRMCSRRCMALPAPVLAHCFQCGTDTESSDWSMQRAVARHCLMVLYTCAGMSARSGAGAAQPSESGQLWVEKHKPQSGADLIGNPGLIGTIREWLQNWYGLSLQREL